MADEEFKKGVPGLGQAAAGERTVADAVMGRKAPGGLMGSQPPKPSIGRTVLYTLTADDALEVNRRIMAYGNQVAEGQEFPMIIVRVYDGGSVNGQVLPDNDRALWVANIPEGTGPKTWRWPPRT